MADQKKGGGISWTTTTWNPIRGCSRVSEGCRNCYAERLAGTRLSGPSGPYEGLATMTAAGPRWTGDVRLIEDKLDEPLRWKRPRLIFVNSMSDLFHESLTFEQIDRIVAVMALADWHTFQVLTKRPERMAEYLGSRPKVKGFIDSRILDAAAAVMQPNDIRKLSWDLPAWPLKNVWWGTSAEDQKTAEARIPQLLRAKDQMAVAWVSLEPLLGPIDLRNLDTAPELHLDALTGIETMAEVPAQGPKLDWVVVGGESGPDARPMHPDWARKLRDECAAAGVPFFMKQMDGHLKKLEDLPADLQVRHWPNAWSGFAADSTQTSAAKASDGR